VREEKRERERRGDGGVERGEEMGA